MKGKTKKNLDCDGALTNKEMGKTISVTGKPLEENKNSNPCGLIAKSYFNDTYQLFFKNDTSYLNLEIDEKKIAWQDDYKIFDEPEDKEDDDQWWIWPEDDEHF